MKRKFNSMGRVAIALVLALSLSLVMAVPVSANETVALDAPYYEPGDTVTVTVTDAAANTHPTGIDTVEVTAENSLADKVEGIVLEETGVDTGIFTGIFVTSDVWPAPEGQLYVQDPDEITVTYVEMVLETAGVTTNWPEVTLDLPYKVTNNDPVAVEATSTTTNPLLGLEYTTVIFVVTIDAPQALVPDNVVLDPLLGGVKVVDGNLVGYWGPAVGFPMGTGYDVTTPFTAKIVDGPLGTYTVTVDLLDLNFEEEGGAAYGEKEYHVLASVSDTTEVIALVPPTLSVDITAPADGANMSKLQKFTVTAVVINTGPVAATSVTATIEVTGNATATGSPTKPAEPAELAVGGSTEVSWTVTCNDVGAVTIEVTPDGKYLAAGTPTPIPEAKLIPDSIGVNQQLPAALKVTALTAPDTVKVGEQFDVSATIENTGGATATDVTAEITISDGYAELAADEPATKPAPPATLSISAGATSDLTWTVTCTALGEAHITVTAAGKDANSEDSISDSKGKSATVAQTEAAVLEVITLTAETSPFIIGDEITVTATVENTGMATAKDVALTLSIDATAALAEDEVATQTVGYLAPGDTSSTVTWILECTAAGKSKITVSPSGTDVLTGVAILAPSLIAADVTVLQSVTTETITLYEGWNLISLPLIPTPTDSDIDMMLADLIDAETVIQVRAYNASDKTWSIWASTGPYALNPTLTEMKDGRGFWINMSTGGDLDAIGSVLPAPPQTPPTYSVYEGWNLIGFTSLGEFPVTLYLGPAIAGSYTWIEMEPVLVAPGTIEAMYGYDAFTGGYTVIQVDEELVPGAGYWLAVNADGTIYP